MKKWFVIFLFPFVLAFGMSKSTTYQDPVVSKPLVVILLGPPGSGKGTQAAPLSDKLHLPHISTGDLFREKFSNQTELEKKAQGYMKEGKLVPDEIVLDILFDRISREDCKNGYILDGFPRTVAQAEALDKRLNDKVEKTAIHFSAPDSVLIDRISGRIVCKSCFFVHHKTFLPPEKEGVCDKCGEEIFQREDDKVEIVKKRLEIYREQIQPLIDYYSRKENTLKNVDSAQTYQEIQEELGHIFQ